MASVAQLKAALKEALERKGVLGQIKARIRTEVFDALDDPNEPRPPLTRENFLINELIREYLKYNKYSNAAHVLTAVLITFPESGQPEVSLDRQFLVEELNIVESASGKSVPLLYAILSHFLRDGKEESNQNTPIRMTLLNYPKQNFNKPPSERN